MRLRTRFTAVLLLITLAILPEFGSFVVLAQDAPPDSSQNAPPDSSQNAPPDAQQLDQLLAPVALYPDSLLSQITTASTNPQEILDVDNWLAQNQGLTGAALTDAAQQQGFDPAFIALVNFPQVLEMMAQHIDDYAAIGTAFSADQGAVAASIQRLRNQAYQAGTLRSNSQQQVQVQSPPGAAPIYVIQPANPQIVYVPQYDPTIVYIRPVTPVVTPFITFGIGIGIGALLVDNQPWGWGGWGWNWGARRAYYNHVYWGGWVHPYRPPQVWFRPRPIIWANRPGYRGNWGYRPTGYRPPQPGPRPLFRAPNPSGRPTVQPVRPGAPNGAFPNRPGNPGTPNGGFPNRSTNTNTPRATPPNRPAAEQPRVGRPTTPGEIKPTPNPSTRPERPSGTSRPSNGPTSQPKTEHESRPKSRKPDSKESAPKHERDEKPKDN